MELNAEQVQALFNAWIKAEMLNDDAMYDAMDALVSVGLLVDAIMVTDSTTVGDKFGFDVG